MFQTNVIRKDFFKEATFKFNLFSKHKSEGFWKPNLHHVSPAQNPSIALHVTDKTQRPYNGPVLHDLVLKHFPDLLSYYFL